MRIPIKEILLERMMNQEEKFGLGLGAFNPLDLPQHNPNLKQQQHSYMINRSQLGFAQGQPNTPHQGHLGNSHINAWDLAKQQNDLNLVNHITSNQNKK